MLTLGEEKEYGLLVHLVADMPAARMASRGLMDLRVARKVAALTGVAGPADGSEDAGGGQAWLADHRLLTMTELILGAPVRGTPPRAGVTDNGAFVRDGRRFAPAPDTAVEYQPIPNVALSRYGPDTKAALVLTGANRVLEPVTDAVQHAMAHILGHTDDPLLVLAVAQCLLQEVFQAQPVLVLNAIQAGLIQRALMLSAAVTEADPGGPRSLARVEFGWQDEPESPPEDVDLTARLWDSLVAPGTLFDSLGQQLSPAGSTPYLRPRPLSEFEQDGLHGSTGDAEARRRLVVQLRDSSEAQLAHSAPGTARCRLWVRRPSGRNPYVDVVVPRQRQIEVMLATLAHRLVDGLPSHPHAEVHPLRLPELDPARWRRESLLRRRAVLLAHYYAIRAAGWLAGMTALDRRRDRGSCARQCGALVEAARDLLDEDDPLRTQLSVFGLGYLLRYEVTRGGTAGFYPELADAVDRMIERAGHDGPGRAAVLEQLEMVLYDLNSARRAAAWHHLEQPRPAALTADMRRWWATARELRDQLIDDERERTYLDHDYAAFLIESADPAEVLAGLELLREVTPERERAARREGRWSSLRVAYRSYLRGLATALDERLDERTTGSPDPVRAADWARQAVQIADRVREHPETDTYLRRRADTGPGGPAVALDLAVFALLLDLAAARVAAVLSGGLDPDERHRAEVGAEDAVREVNAYLAAVRRGDDSPESLATLRMPLAQAEALTRHWADGARRAGGGSG